MLMRSGAAAAVVLAALPLGASAQNTANDLSPSLNYLALVSTLNGKTTESGSFTIGTSLSWDGGEPVTVKLSLQLPAGIRWAGNAPGGDGCSRTEEQAVCTKEVTPTEGTNLAATLGPWQVVAERAGSYTFEAAILSTSRPDPNPSNDSTSMTVNVRDVPGGVALKPNLPKAGFDVVASHGVFIQSPDRTFPVVEGSVSCSANIGSVTAKAKGALSSGRATCTIKTRKSATGKLISGTIRTASAGLVSTKEFRVKLR